MKENTSSKRVVYLLTLLLWAIWTGCSKENDDIIPGTSDTIDDQVLATAQIFNEWYLWYNQIPDIDLKTVETPSDFLEKIRIDQDPWSFVAPLDEIMALIQNGESTGWGATFKYDQDEKVRIADVYADSPMGNAGIQRGWMIKSLNGTLVANMSTNEINNVLAQNSATYTFVDLASTEHELTITKGMVNMNTIHFSEVYERNNRKIGYFVFSDFFSTSIDELDAVFADFKAAGVQDLIIDLRYNGGGVVLTADHLAGLILGADYTNQVYNTQTYNDKNSNNNTERTILLKDQSFTPENLVCITTSNSASASEILIAGIDPFIDVKLIGTQTHGKPVGMSIFSYEEENLAIAPVSFKNVNKVGYSDYYDGIPVDLQLVEDVSKTWGDPEEVLLKQALNYLETGTLTAVSLKAGMIEHPTIYRGVDKPINEALQLINR